jgi:hypothetical protein
MKEENLIDSNELCLQHGIEVNFIYSLQEYGLIEVTTVEEKTFIAAEQLSELEKMIRLHSDLNVNIDGIDVIYHLLKRMEAAQEKINELNNKLRFYGQ